ncbi:MAG: GldG family protein [Clostridia bacterium]|nr:GldG family protein [Clostridia bacterium]
MNQNDNNKQKGGIAALLGINKATRVGTWTVAMTLIVLAVLVVVNLLVGALPSSWTRIDTTDQGLYTISATSEKFVKSVKRDVSIYVLSEGGVMSGTLQTFLDRYTSFNSRIRVKAIDPVADPTFLDGYPEVTTSGNYIIVESDLRHTVVDISALEYYYVTGYGEMDVATYNEMTADSATVEAIKQYYGIDMNAATLYFAGEKAITAAIEYVSLETIPHIYVLSGNGEAAMSKALTEMFDLALLEYEVLTLQAGESVPADASCLIINAPTYDLSESAAAAIKAFLKDGGNLMLITTPDNTAMPNLMSLVADYGAAPTTGGMLYEGNANKYVQEPYILKPTINTEHTITYMASSQGYGMIMPRAHGILLDETLPEGVTATTLFSATDAYTVASDGSETDYGKVACGVALEDKNTESKVAWFASLDAFTDGSYSAYGPGATYYFAIAASWENDAYESSLGAIEALDMTEQPMNVSARAMLAWGAILILIIPLCFVISGIVVWIIRRRR